ncbi:hypothetical protein GGF32_005765 [Allomyces javanicus]|nr:hypothetical protein GGF32_005765 [Allomyces javanicus]
MTDTTTTATAAPAADPMAQYANPEATDTSFLGPDYEINPRYRDAIAAVFAAIDMDKDGHLTPYNLLVEAGPENRSIFDYSKDVLRQIYQRTGTQYRDSDVAINLDAYLNLMAIMAQVEPESTWGILRRMRGRNVHEAEVLQKLKRTDMPSGELRTPRAQLHKAVASLPKCTLS